MENYLKGVKPGRLTATEKAIIKGKWFWTKVTIGILVMAVAASVVVWSIYQMVLIHRFIMSL